MGKIIYEVETAHYGGKNKNKSKNVNRNEEWVREKRNIALKSINNAAVLVDVAKTMKLAAEKHPDASLNDAIKKIDGIIEEMRVEFKKNYTL